MTKERLNEVEFVDDFLLRILRKDFEAIKENLFDNCIVVFCVSSYKDLTKISVTNVFVRKIGF